MPKIHFSFLGKSGCLKGHFHCFECFEGFSSFGPLQKHPKASQSKVSEFNCLRDAWRCFKSWPKPAKARGVFCYHFSYVFTLHLRHPCIPEPLPHGHNPMTSGCHVHHGFNTIPILIVLPCFMYMRLHLMTMFQFLVSDRETVSHVHPSILFP